MALLAFAIISYWISEPYAQTLEDTSNLNAVNNWVTTVSSGLYKVSHTGSTRPPVAYIEKPLDISSNEDLKKAGENIVGSIHTCWKAFEFGEKDFMSPFEFGEEIFCYTCRELEFDESFLNSKITDIGTIYNTQPSSGKKYYQLMPPYQKVDENKLNNFEIKEKQYYITFIGSKNFIKCPVGTCNDWFIFYVPIGGSYKGQVEVLTAQEYVGLCS